MKFRFGLCLLWIAALLAGCAPAVRTVQVEVTRQVVRTLPVERVVVQTVEVTRVVPQTVVVSATPPPPPTRAVTATAQPTPSRVIWPSPAASQALTATYSAPATRPPAAATLPARSPTTGPAPGGGGAPLALASLQDGKVHFECLDRKTCLPDIDLSGQPVMSEPYVLGRAYYASPESLYLTLRSKSTNPARMDILHVNPKSGAIKAIESPEDPTYSLLVPVAGRLALARYQGRTVNIIDSELAVTPVPVSANVDALVAAGQRVIAMDLTPVEQAGGVLMNLATIDLPEAIAASQRVALNGFELYHGRMVARDTPAYLLYLFGVREDLQAVYAGYRRGTDPTASLLGSVEVASGKQLAAIPGSTHTEFGQYHDLLYWGKGGTDDGGPGPALYNMTSGRSLLDFTAHPDWQGQKLLIKPFGDNMLLGRADEIIVLSPAGEILARYPLPDAWVNRDYNIVNVEQ